MSGNDTKRGDGGKSGEGGNPDGNEPRRSRESSWVSNIPKTTTFELIPHLLKSECVKSYPNATVPQFLARDYYFLLFCAKKEFQNSYTGAIMHPRHALFQWDSCILLRTATPGGGCEWSGPAVTGMDGETKQHEPALLTSWLA